MKELEHYQKYRWFFTTSKKLVVGGKSAVQNDFLLYQLKKALHDYIVMHTADPGSPFTVILADLAKITKNDLEECAIFTVCFSQAWRSGRKTAAVDIFTLSQVVKDATMKPGTWGVHGNIEKVIVPLELVLVQQHKRWRAVPEKSVTNKKAPLIKLCPGDITKKDLAAKLEIELDMPFNEEELLAALPSGGFKICR